MVLAVRWAPPQRAGARHRPHLHAALGGVEAKGGGAGGAGSLRVAREAVGGAGRRGSGGTLRHARRGHRCGRAQRQRCAQLFECRRARAGMKLACVLTSSDAPVVGRGARAQRERSAHRRRRVAASQAGRRPAAGPTDTGGCGRPTSHRRRAQQHQGGHSQPGGQPARWGAGTRRERVMDGHRVRLGEPHKLAGGRHNTWGTTNPPHELISTNAIALCERGFPRPDHSMNSFVQAASAALESRRATSGQGWRGVVDWAIGSRAHLRPSEQWLRHCKFKWSTLGCVAGTLHHASTPRRARPWRQPAARRSSTGVEAPAAAARLRAHRSGTAATFAAPAHHRRHRPVTAICPAQPPGACKRHTTRRPLTRQSCAALPGARILVCGTPAGLHLTFGLNDGLLL